MLQNAMEAMAIGAKYWAEQAGPREHAGRKQPERALAEAARTQRQGVGYGAVRRTRGRATGGWRSGHSLGAAGMVPLFSVRWLGRAYRCF